MGVALKFALYWHLALGSSLWNFLFSSLGAETLLLISLYSNQAKALLIQILKGEL